jgi:hypothetical protein
MTYKDPKWDYKFHICIYAQLSKVLKIKELSLSYCYESQRNINH